MIARRLLAGLLLVACPPLLGAKQPSPQPLYVDVVFVEPGPVGLREQIEHELLLALDRARCFSAVKPYRGDEAPGGEAVLLRMAIANLVDETTFDLSIAERYAPDAMPDAQRRLTSWLEIDFQLELHLLPDAIPLRVKPRNIRTGYRPRLDEDPREENRLQAVDELVRAARLFACQASPKKLRKEIDRARADR